MSGWIIGITLFIVVALIITIVVESLYIKKYQTDIQEKTDDNDALKKQIDANTADCETQKTDIQNQSAGVTQELTDCRSRNESLTKDLSDCQATCSSSSSGSGSGSSASSGSSSESFDPLMVANINTNNEMPIDGNMNTAPNSYASAVVNPQVSMEMSQTIPLAIMKNSQRPTAVNGQITDIALTDKGIFGIKLDDPDVDPWADWAKWQHPANLNAGAQNAWNFQYLAFANPKQYWNAEKTNYNYYDAEIAKNLSHRYFNDVECDKPVLEMKH